jgi:hypothetical protein
MDGGIRKSTLGKGFFHEHVRITIFL